ncbi:flagellar protein [Salibacterium salarium]|uniref:Flagellar protein FliT n=1 Tax=Salibacterium salarium TaxID=284579 RepID=A0A3R9PYR8_9BACI|nr:flagellar protein [Salibacterium salarium]RSL29977.1 flagellar protein [Salibacterium salarium]
MALAEELYQVTKALYDHVSRPLPKELDARDQYVEDVEHYLEKRGSLLQQLEQDSGDADMEESMSVALLKMNEEIQRHIEASRGELRLGMQQLKKKKQSSQRYERPYTGPTVDGIFFDKKN